MAAIKEVSEILAERMKCFSCSTNVMDEKLTLVESSYGKFFRLKCPSCNKLNGVCICCFKSYSRVDKHIKIHENTELECLFCKRKSQLQNPHSYTKVESLITHSLSHFVFSDDGGEKCVTSKPEHFHYTEDDISTTEVNNQLEDEDRRRITDGVYSGGDDIEIPVEDDEGKDIEFRTKTPSKFGLEEEENEPVKADDLEEEEEEEEKDFEPDDLDEEEEGEEFPSLTAEEIHYVKTGRYSIGFESPRRRTVFNETQDEDELYTPSKERKSIDPKSPDLGKKEMEDETDNFRFRYFDPSGRLTDYFYCPFFISDTNNKVLSEFITPKKKKEDSYCLRDYDDLYVKRHKLLYPQGVYDFNSITTNFSEFQFSRFVGQDLIAAGIPIFAFLSTEEEGRIEDGSYNDGDKVWPVLESLEFQVFTDKNDFGPLRTKKCKDWINLMLTHPVSDKFYNSMLKVIGSKVSDYDIPQSSYMMINSYLGRLGYQKPLFIVDDTDTTNHKNLWRKLFENKYSDYPGIKYDTFSIEADNHEISIVPSSHCGVPFYSTGYYIQELFSDIYQRINMRFFYEKREIISEFTHSRRYESMFEDAKKEKSIAVVIRDWADGFNLGRFTSSSKTAYVKKCLNLPRCLRRKKEYSHVTCIAPKCFHCKHIIREANCVELEKMNNGFIVHDKLTKKYVRVKLYTLPLFDQLELHDQLDHVAPNSFSKKICVRDFCPKSDWLETELPEEIVDLQKIHEDKKSLLKDYVDKKKGAKTAIGRFQENTGFKSLYEIRSSKKGKLSKRMTLPPNGFMTHNLTERTPKKQVLDISGCFHHSNIKNLLFWYMDFVRDGMKPRDRNNLQRKFIRYSSKLPNSCRKISEETLKKNFTQLSDFSLQESIILIAPYVFDAVALDEDLDTENEKKDVITNLCVAYSLCLRDNVIVSSALPNITVCFSAAIKGIEKTIPLVDDEENDVKAVSVKPSIHLAVELLKRNLLDDLIMMKDCSTKEFEVLNLDFKQKVLNAENKVSFKRIREQFHFSMLMKRIFIGRRKYTEANVFYGQDYGVFFSGAEKDNGVESLDVEGYVLDLDDESMINTCEKWRNIAKIILLDHRIQLFPRVGEEECFIKFYSYKMKMVIAGVIRNLVWMKSRIQGKENILLSIDIVLTKEVVSLELEIFDTVKVGFAGEKRIISIHQVISDLHVIEKDAEKYLNLLYSPVL